LENNIENIKVNHSQELKDLKTKLIEENEENIGLLKVITFLFGNKMSVSFFITERI
jgi:hypothetical protein